MKRGVAKGRGLGIALAEAEKAWIARGFPTDKSTVAEIADAVARTATNEPTA